MEQKFPAIKRSGLPSYHISGVRSLIPTRRKDTYRRSETIVRYEIDSAKHSFYSRALAAPIKQNFPLRGLIQ